MIDTILFDLDGTLLPINERAFAEIYIRELTQKVASLGIEPAPVAEAVWAGVAAMQHNDGSRTNEAVFWPVFEARMGVQRADIEAPLMDFYANEFGRARAAAWDNPQAAPVVRALQQKGYTLVVATNPVFPAVAVETRLSWLGLSAEDFAWVTTYENAGYCKPNLDYYREILAGIGKQPNQCLMVGNNLLEDGCVQGIPMAFYLVTDCLLNPEDAPLAGVRHGSFVEAAAYLAGLPDLNMAAGRFAAE